MGRPIKKKFFGNLINPYQNHATGGKTGVGGEGFGAVIVTNPTANSAYTTATTLTWTASAPQISGGITASGTVTVSPARNITALTVTEAGSGYTSTGSVTVTISSGTAGTAVTYAVQLTSNRPDSLTIVSYLPTASQSRTNGDILKQESSRRYLVQNTDGKGICRLSTGTLAAGQMHIIGTDAGGATYWVTKLTARKAVVYPRTNTSTAYLSYGQTTKWTLGSPSGSSAADSVISLNHTI
jgi:hypothetical protein